MGSIKEINIKNRTYYFYNDIIDIEIFDSNNLKLDKKLYKDLDIYNIGYVTNKKIGFGARDENKKLLKRYDDVLNGIMSKVKAIDDDWLEYSKNYVKIKFSSDDNLPLNKPLKFHNVIVTIRCVFSEDNKLYSQVFVDGVFFSL